MSDPYQDHPQNDPGYGAMWTSVGGGTRWVPVSSNDVTNYGAKVDGITDDAVALQNAINTGGLVTVSQGKSGGVCLIRSTITLKSDTVLMINPGATVKWGGTAGGAMFTTGTDVPTRRTGVVGGGQISPQTAGCVYDLHSVQESVFDVAEIRTGSATLVGMRLQSDAASGVGGYESSVNSVFNEVRLLLSGQCGTALVLSGASANAPVTLNRFIQIEAQNVQVTGISFVQWCDTNEFGIVRLELGASNSNGVIVNDSATPTADVGVYANTFNMLAIDTFVGGQTGRVALTLNKTKQLRVNSFYNNPPAEGGVIVDNNCDSYDIGQSMPSGLLERYVKNVTFKNAPGGNQVVIDETGLRVLNPSGVEQFSVKGSDGTISASGAMLNKSGIYDSAGVNKLVANARQIGWTAATGTPTRATFVTSTVLLPALAEHVKALIDDLIAHGLIGT